MLKNNKGITLVSLAITIVVVIIISTVAVTYGTGAVNYIKFNNAKAQIQTMQSNVNNWYQEYKTIEENKKDEWLANYGEAIEISNLDSTKVANTLYNEETEPADATNYKYFSAEYLKNDLGIDGISYDFLINIKDNDVRLYGGIKYLKQKYYSAEQFGIKKVTYKETSGNITFKTAIKENKLIVYDIKFPDDMEISKYTVSCKLYNENFWTTITLDKKREYRYTNNSGNTVIDNKAWYINLDGFGVRHVKVTAESLTSSQEHISYGWWYKEDSEGRKTIITDGENELKIGDYINYNAMVKEMDTDGNEKYISYTSPTGTYEKENNAKITEQTQEGSGYSVEQTFSCDANTNGWRILGADETTGEILIISADSVKTTSGNKYYLRGYTGIQWGEKELNDICEIFGHGYGASLARSINIDDINKITGYNPKNVGVYDPAQVGTGTIYNEGNLGQYGNEVTYSWTDTKKQIRAVEGTYGSVTGFNDNYEINGFNWFCLKEKKWYNSMQDTANPIEITKVISSDYTYYPYTLSEESSKTGIRKGISLTSPEYSTLFDSNLYWVASICMSTATDSVWNRIFYVSSGKAVKAYTLCYSYGNFEEKPNYGIRPVVYLRKDIQLKYNDENIRYDIVK